MFFVALTARLKSCPVSKQPMIEFFHNQQRRALEQNEPVIKFFRPVSHPNRKNKCATRVGYPTVQASPDSIFQADP
jgi:hypothetical protein